ncbi:MAG: AraC family transcriptional regulator [Bacteroidia bacterium]|nr:AraC family transcriptional regulator [Bacteroidia bacterium]
MEIAYEKLFIDENRLFHYQEFIQPHFTSPFHLHDEFELILIVKSHGKLFIGNSITNFTDGELYLFAPGLPHCFFNTRGYDKGNELAHAIVIQFRKDFLGDAFFEKNEVSNLKRLIKKSESGVQFINPDKSLRKRIQTLSQRKGLESLADLLLLLNDLASKKNIKLLSAENIINLSSLNDSRIINNVYKYVADNFQKKISFDVAASVANMQRSAFCRYFKRKTKKKFTQFVNEIRIMHSCKLLAETDKTVIEVAFECGYENTSYFNRQFRLYCDICPTAFREQLKHK